jgi:hypothetical protein
LNINLKEEKIEHEFERNKYWIWICQNKNKNWTLIWKKKKLNMNLKERKIEHEFERRNNKNWTVVISESEWIYIMAQYEKSSCLVIIIHTMYVLHVFIFKFNQFLI